MASISPIRCIAAATLLMVVGTCPGQSPDRPGVFFFDANHFELQTGGAIDDFDLSFQYPHGRTGFSLIRALAGDFDGDGLDTIGIYDISAQRFQLSRSNAPGPDDLVIDFGAAGTATRPFAGDFNGDGVDSIGVFDQWTTRFRIRFTNASGPADAEFAFGPVGSIPLAGDFNGDGFDTIGTYHLATGTFSLRNQLSAGAADHVFVFGPPQSLPIAGDFNGDGIDTVGVYDQVNSQFLMRDSHSAGPADHIIPVRPTKWLWEPIAGKWQVPDEPPMTHGYAWPMSTPAAENIDGPTLNLAIAHAKTIDPLYSLLVIRHGKLVSEDYFGGYRESIAGNVKSVSKSLLSTLVGLAIRDGHMTSIDQTAASILPQYFVQVSNEQKRDITLGDMMTMRSGLAFNEGNIYPWFFSPDPHDFVISQQLTHAPGTAFNYSSGLTHLMTRMLREVTGLEPPVYGRSVLFEPLGITVPRWDRDLNGDHIGGAEFYLKPRDMARFGQMFLRQGRIDGHQVVPRAWVDFATSELVPPSEVPWEGSGYGAWWWRRQAAGQDFYFAAGYGGQFIIIVPELDLVVVATSDWTVGATGSSQQVGTVLDLLGNWVLPAIKPDPLADLDHDGDVDAMDFITLLLAWGPNPGHAADLDDNGFVGIDDFLAFLAAWSTGRPGSS